VNVSVGQIVPASTAVFEVSSQTPVWIRVPIYVGDLETIDANSNAQIQPLGEARSSESRPANPVEGPTLSDPKAASADLYYRMNNEDGRFRLNQKIIATIIQKGEEQGLTVPVSAIVYDVQGGTWVYVNTMPQTYQRTRVELLHIVDDYALLANGPEPGKEVVIEGTAELFGTEFGAGK
jgi:membrane fusion protein, heavy metal efflux system